MKASFGFKNTGIKLTGDDVPVQVDSSTPVNLPFNPLKTETTTSHDQISEESRALENQHPASSISWGDGNVDEALQAQSTLIGNLSDSWTDTTEALQKVSDGGEIENSLYDWFKGVYTSLVDGSVKSWVMGLVNQLKAVFDKTSDLQVQLDVERFKILTSILSSGMSFGIGLTGGSTSTTTAPMANVLKMSPFAVDSDVNVDNISVNIYTAYSGGYMRLFMYKGNPFYPYELLWTSDEISQSSTGINSIGCNIVLEKGKIYWIGYITNNTTVRFGMLVTYNMPSLSATPPNSGVLKYVTINISYNYGIPPSNLDGYSIVFDTNVNGHFVMRKA